jgi:protoporphyrinogen IX oxidase
MDVAYKYILAVHIIFVVCWMAGLFYIVRLFIYHTEAQEKPEPERKILSAQFEIMERRLWNVITIPSMYIVLAAGITMLCIVPAWLQQGWLHIKLNFVLILIIYHFICQNKIKQMRNGVFKWKSTQLRLWNELATLLLFMIVICAVVKNQVNWPYTIIGLIVLVFLLMAGVKFYKYLRNKNPKI